MLVSAARTISVLILLIALSTIAQASDDGKTNVYDDFSELLKPSADASVEQQVTVRIKRYMAALLYPVDMSTFTGPDKDEKFRGLIMVLQKQMGAPMSGVLTSDQFNLLAEAAKDISGPLIAPEMGKFVSVKNGILIARGTGTMDDIADPINRVSIVCIKQESTCESRVASFDVQTNMLSLSDLIYYEIKTWTPDRVTAIREHRCGTATMTIDVKAEEITIMSAHGCLNDKPSIWKLTDGFPIAWKLISTVH